MSATQITLKQSGGITGLTLEGSISISELPDDLASRVNELIESNRLQYAQAAPTNLNMTDAQTYELTLVDPSSGMPPQKYTYSEAQDAPLVLELLNDLSGEIIKHQRQHNKRD